MKACRRNIRSRVSSSEESVTQLRPAIKPVAKTLHELNYRFHPIDFENALADEELRRILVTDFAADDVTLLLRALPDFFVVSQELEDGIFFVTYLDSGQLDPSREAIFRKYYPSDILLVRSVHGELFGRWFGEDGEAPLDKALSSVPKRFGRRA